MRIMPDKNDILIYNTLNGNSNVEVYLCDEDILMTQAGLTDLFQTSRNNTTMHIQNTYKEGANVDYSRFFERFYREDEAHNVDRGGYGIGLSIAESICHQYGGSINASWKNDEIIFTCLLN